MIEFDKDNKVTFHKDDLLQLLTSLSVAMWHPRESMASAQRKYDVWLEEHGLIDGKIHSKIQDLNTMK